MEGTVATGSDGQRISPQEISEHVAHTHELTNAFTQKFSDRPLVADMNKTVDAFAQLSTELLGAGEEAEALLWANAARRSFVIAKDLVKAGVQGTLDGLAQFATKEHLQSFLRGQVELAAHLFGNMAEFLNDYESFDMHRIETIAGQQHAQAMAFKAMIKAHHDALKAMPWQQATHEMARAGTVFMLDGLLCHRLTLIGRGILSPDAAAKMGAAINKIEQTLVDTNPFAPQLATNVAGVGKVFLEHGTEACEDALALLKEAPELLVQEGATTAQVVSEAAEATKIISEASPIVNDVTNIVSENALPNFKNAKIDIRKLSEYALNPDHPVGGHKARVFESALGYKKDHANVLLDQIYKKLPQYEAIPGRVDQFGQRYTVDIQITGINGNTTVVRTGWILKQGSIAPELTTLFIK